MLKKSFSLFLLALVCVCTVFSESASLSKLSYEVKFLLDPAKTVNADMSLAADVSSLFKVSKTQKRSVVYVETPDRAFLNTGWINRIREKDGKKNLELTYKMRYSIQNNDIDGTVSRALRDFSAFSDSRKYEAQIDWGYNQMTLSFSAEKKYSKPKGGLKGMSTAAMVDVIKSNMTDEEKTGSGSFLNSPSVTATSCVDYVQYSGKFNKTEVDIEVWNIGGKPVAELSFKANSFDSASSMRSELIQLLDSKGLLLHQDSLKTTLILDTLL